MFKKIQLFTLVIICLISVTSKTHAQTAIGSASGKAVINNQLHEWSVGEMCAVATTVSPVLIVTQGFLQPQEAPVSTDETAFIFGDLQVVPNPTAAIATLRGHIPVGSGTVRFEMLDVKGALLQSGSTDATGDGLVEQHFDLSTQPAGTYFLHLQIKNAVSTFSIVKL